MMLKRFNTVTSMIAMLAIIAVALPPVALGEDGPEVVDYSEAYFDEPIPWPATAPLVIDFQEGDNAGIINISGATLFSDYTKNAASSNDWSNPDCDFDCFNLSGDCIGGVTGDVCDDDNSNCAFRGWNEDRILGCGLNEVDVLTTAAVSSPLDTFWVLNYRGVGSTNGIQEFVNYNASFLNSAENAPGAPNSDASCPGLISDGSCPAACTTDIVDALFDETTGACRDGGPCGATCEVSGVCTELGIDSEICDLDILEPTLLNNPANPDDDEPNPDYDTDNIFTIAQAIAGQFGCVDSDCFFAPVVYPATKASENSNINQVRYHQGSSGACSGPWDIDQAAPSTCAFVAMQTVDIHSSDVPTKWGIQFGGDEDARWDRKPTEEGYGRNATTSDTDFSNRLKNLFFDSNNDGIIQDNERLNTNTDNPDCRTVFDTQVAHSVVSFITNRGTGVENVDQTDLQHHFVAGRFISGLNLAAATRDSGSGTRNIAMNGICADPSYGLGENRADKQSTANNTNLGPGTQRSNCGGSSVMENVVRYHRLALGYTGFGRWQPFGGRLGCRSLRDRQPAQRLPRLCRRGSRAPKQGVHHAEQQPRRLLSRRGRADVRHAR